MTLLDRFSCVLIGERTKMYGNWLTDSPNDRWMSLGRPLIGLLYDIRRRVTCTAPSAVIGSRWDILAVDGVRLFHPGITVFLNDKLFCNS